MVAHLTIDNNGKRGDEPGFDKNNVKMYGLGSDGAGGGDWGQTQWSAFTGSAGWQATDKNPWGTKFNLDQPALQDTLAWYFGLAAKGYMPSFEEIGGNNPVGPDKQIQSGIAAMALSGSWMISTFSGLTDAGGKKLDIGLAPTPIGPTGKRASMFNGLADSITKLSKQPEDAAKWVKFLSGEECQNIIGESGIVFPARPKGTELAVAFNKKERNLDVTPFTDQVTDKTTFLFPVTTNAADITALMRPRFDAVYIGSEPGQLDDRPQRPAQQPVQGGRRIDSTGDAALSTVTIHAAATRLHDDAGEPRRTLLTQALIQAPGRLPRGLTLSPAGPLTAYPRGETVMIDHRKLGRELELFCSDPLAGAGLPIWLPDGAAARHAVEEYLREKERRAGYRHVVSPPLGKRELFELSGHAEHFSDDMFPPMRMSADDELVLRPSLCPHHALVFRVPRPVLPRAAAADRRDRRDVPLGALRGARRAEPGPGHLAQRRAHLLRGGPGARRGRPRAGADPAGARRPGRAAVRLPAVAARRGRQVRRRSGDVGAGLGSAARKPWTSPASITPKRPARRRSTGRRSTSRYATTPAGSRPCPPCRSTTTNRPASGCRTWPPTAPGRSR